MQNVDIKTYNDLLIDLVIHEQKKRSAPVHEQPFMQIPIPEPPTRWQEVEKEEAPRVIIIDI
jgi:hypothetical protein